MVYQDFVLTTFTHPPAMVKIVEQKGNFGKYATKEP